MEIKINNTKFIEKWLASKVRQAKELVEREIEKIPQQAQNNYDNFIIEVPADDPYVDVYTHTNKTKDKTELTIQCRGTQVIFIEFGAGIYYYTEKELQLYKNYMQGVNPRGNPKVDEIGFYHNSVGEMSRGQDDLWAYKSQTGRTSENAHLLRYNRAGEPIMITHGNRPSRSLYRACGMAKKRIYSQFNKKARRIGG